MFLNKRSAERSGAAQSPPGRASGVGAAGMVKLGGAMGSTGAGGPARTCRRRRSRTPGAEVLPRAPTNFAEVVGARLRRDADENARLRHQLRCLRNGEDGGEDLGEDGGEGVLGGVASLGVCLGMKRPSAASTTP